MLIHRDVIRDYHAGVGQYAIRPPGFIPRTIDDNPFIPTGIEIELEGVPMEEVRGRDRWNMVGDGSLRNYGLELLSRPIITNEMLRNYMTEYDLLRRQNAFLDTVRTSTHVHLDARALSVPRFVSLLAAYALVEPLLYRRCGALREENIYCVPHYRGDTLTPAIPRGLLAGNLRDTLGRQCKYSGLYLSPLNTFGTIEFRMAPSFPTAADVMEWVRGLHTLYRGGALLRPDEAIEAIESGHYEGLVGSLLPPNWVNYDPGELADMIEDNDCDRRALKLLRVLVPGTPAKWDMAAMPAVPFPDDMVVLGSNRFAPSIEIDWSDTEERENEEEEEEEWYGPEEDEV